MKPIKRSSKKRDDANKEFKTQMDDSSALNWFLRIIGVNNLPISDISELESMDTSHLNVGDWELIHKIFAILTAVSTGHVSKKLWSRRKRSNSAFEFPWKLFENPQPTMTLLKGLRKEVVVNFAEAWSLYSEKNHFIQNPTEVHCAFLYWELSFFEMLRKFWSGFSWRLFSSFAAWTMMSFLRKWERPRTSSKPVWRTRRKSKTWKGKSSCWNSFITFG